MKIKKNLGETLVTVIGIVTCIFLICFDIREMLNIDDKAYYIILGAFEILLPVIIVFIINFLLKGFENDTEKMHKKYDNIYNEIKSSVIPEDSVTKKNNDILEFMLDNMREIRDYYVLSKSQAKNSFVLAVAMCIVGLILMGVSIFAAFFQSNNVILSVIPAVGAAIVEVIAGTSLFVYKNSLSQLNHYFNSLHSNERFLSIVNIVSKASPEVQDDMYFEIIKSQIGVVSTDVVEDKNEESKVK